MLINIRLYSQQLTEPTFDTPKEIVSWMGAIQAQNYNMAKWAIGIRLKHVTDNIIEKSLPTGRNITNAHIASYMALYYCRRYTLDAEALGAANKICQ